MRIVSFNVNGLRSIREYYAVCRGWTFDQFLASLSADILCFQETKIGDVSRLDHELAFPAEYVAFFSFLRTPKKIGYSGVATFCRKSGWAPCGFEDGFSGVFGGETAEGLVGPLGGLRAKFTEGELRLLDGEGRCMITDHVLFVLLNVYFPNDSGPERAGFREKFYGAIWSRSLTLLQSGRSVVIAGDVNVSYHPMDHCDYAGAFRDLCARVGIGAGETLLRQSALALPDEGGSSTPPAGAGFIDPFYSEKPLRRWLYSLLHADPEAQKYRLCDPFRLLHRGEFERYTCWNTQMSARGTNYGTRIDMICTAGALFVPGESIVAADIMSSFMGSDHCPVYVDLQLGPVPPSIPVRPRNTSSLRAQRRLSDFFPKKPPQPASPRKETLDAPLAKKPKNARGPVTLADFFQIGAPERPSEVRTEAPPGPLAWQEIFNRPKCAPLCSGHSEPCRLLAVTKKGANQGRKFYICARGVGQKEDPNTRCEHFEWLNGKRSI